MKITGANIILRDERKETDREDFFRWWNLEEWQYYDEPDLHFASISWEEYDRRLRQREENPPSQDASSHTWQIDTLDGQHIGWVNYYQYDPAERTAFTGIDIPEEALWNKGFGTEALRLLIEYLFQKMGLEEVKTATWTGNKRMVRCAKKCGFKDIVRGPHRIKQSIRGESLERIEFTLNRSEWLAVNEDT